MKLALDEARLGADGGEVPIGAVVVCDGSVIAQTHNRSRELADPTAHAEILALRAAASVVGDWRLCDCDLYVTLEPCAMCAGAIVLGRIRHLFYATADPKAGMCGSLSNIVQDERLNHRVEIASGGECEEEAAALLRSFFKERR